MKTHTSNFEDQYKAFSVVTESGNAFKGDNDERDIDIGAPFTTVFNTKDAKTLYGDTCALLLDKPDGWPGKVTLQSADIHLITLSTTFNEIIRFGAALSRKHGGNALHSIPRGDNKISHTFAACANKDRLTSLGQFFVISHALLNTFGPQDRDLPQIEQGMNDLYMEGPNETVAQFTNPADILPAMQSMLLMNEGDFPGYASTNRYYISGLYAAPVRAATIPLRPQDERAPLLRVMPELHRVMK